MMHWGDTGNTFNLIADSINQLASGEKDQMKRAGGTNRTTLNRCFLFGNWSWLGENLVNEKDRVGHGKRDLNGV